jgi:hypothetical protein
MRRRYNLFLLPTLESIVSNMQYDPISGKTKDLVLAKYDK